MNKKILFSLGAIFALSVPAQAQVEWSLDSCINYAHQHNITVRMRDVDNITAEYGVTEAKDRFLPNVSGSVSQNFAFGRGLNSQNMYENRNTQNFGWQAYLSMPVFQGLAGVRRIDYAKANLAAVVEQYEAAKENVTLNVISQYLQVLLNKEVLAVAEEQVRLQTEEVKRQQELVDAGRVAELDLYQAQSQLAADQHTAATAANDYRLALVDLTQLLQLDSPEGFAVAPIDLTEGVLPAVDDVFASALAVNHGVRAAHASEVAAERNTALARTGYIPTLSFNAGLGSSWYKVNGMSNPTFSSQMRDNFNKTIGFSLNIPIFDGFTTRNSVRRAKAAEVTARLQSEQTRSELYQSIQRAYYQAKGARSRLATGRVAAEAARLAMEAMREKYNYGKANATEFEQTKTAWFRANLEVVQGQYESTLRTYILRFYAGTL